MKVLVVDDELITLRGLVRSLSRLYPEANIVSSSDPVMAEETFEQDVDVAFLDIEMPEMSGIELASRLLTKKENLNVIFLTAYPDYALAAFRLHASGYLTKPASDTMIRKEMDNLRFPLQHAVEAAPELLQVQCFGNFEVFCKGVPIHFLRSGSKAILAYLIDRRGASVTIEELCASFWEDSVDIERKKTNIRTMIKALRRTLKDYGLEEVMISRRNNYAINTVLLDCDYYRFLDDPKTYGDLFHGEYMSQYSWAERTLGNIIDMGW